MFIFFIDDFQVWHCGKVRNFPLFRVYQVICIFRSFIYLTVLLRADEDFFDNYRI